MLKFSFFTLALLISCSAFLLKVSAQDARASAVDTLMAPWSKGGSPGAFVMVIGGGDVLHKKGYGLADLKTHAVIDENTAFNIASISKQFTAMAVMVLAERGKLSYEDPVTKYIPNLPGYAHRITIRHLLNHTSGLADYTIYWDKGPSVNKPGAAYSAAGVISFLTGRKRPDFAAGENWRYSNSGYVLLTEIVAKTSGIPFPQFVKENIFRPLDMNDSFVYDTTRPRPKNIATGYAPDGKGFKKADHNPDNFIAGDDDLYTTAADLFKWDQALYTEKIVRSAALKEAFTPGTLNDGTRFNYSFGWAFGKYNGMPFLSHSGGTAGYAAHILRFPEHQFTVIIMSNFEEFSPPAYSLANKIAAIYLGDKMSPPAAAGATASVPPNANGYAGNYEFYDIRIKVSVENGALWVSSGGNKKAKLSPVGGDEFAVEGNTETTYCFMRNTKGTVTGISLLGINGLFLTRQPD